MSWKDVWASITTGDSRSVTALDNDLWLVPSYTGESEEGIAALHHILPMLHGETLI